MSTTTSPNNIFETLKPLFDQAEFEQSLWDTHKDAFAMFGQLVAQLCEIEALKLAQDAGIAEGLWLQELALRINEKFENGSFVSTPAFQAYLNEGISARRKVIANLELIQMNSTDPDLVQRFAVEALQAAEKMR